MSWFGKKKEKSIAELPPLPDDFREFPKMPDYGIKDELPPLPSIAFTQTSEKTSNEAVKQLVKEPEFKEQEMIEFPAQKKLTQEIEPSEFMPRAIVREIPRKVEPVYVRIDKYQESLLSFHEVKKKLLEIENLLKDVKELKDKEERELQDWEEEVKKAKEKLAEIDSALFQRLG